MTMYRRSIMSEGNIIQPEYEALGIHPDTMACVGVMSKADAKRFVWILATNGVGAVAARDPDKKRWHVAVLGSFGYNPVAYFSGIRGEVIRTCTSTLQGQHPMEVE